MSIKIEIIKRHILNKFRGNKLTNTKIREELVMKHLKSILDESIVGSNQNSNELIYHTMYKVSFIQEDYERLLPNLKFIVRSTVREMESILRSKVNKESFANFNSPHSPYWQFTFVGLPSGSLIGKEQTPIEKLLIAIDSKVYPEGRNQNTVDAVKDGNTIYSIKSSRPENSDLRNDISTNDFKELREITQGEFVVPFGVLMDGAKKDNANVYLELKIKNGTFLVNGKKVDTYKMCDKELYIGGKNAHSTFNDIPVLRINDSNIMTPHAFISIENGVITVKAFGKATYYTRNIDQNGITVKKDTSILLNDNFQLTIK